MEHRPNQVWSFCLLFSFHGGILNSTIAERGHYMIIIVRDSKSKVSISYWYVFTSPLLSSVELLCTTMVLNFIFQVRKITTWVKTFCSNSILKISQFSSQKYDFGLLDFTVSIKVSHLQSFTPQFFVRQMCTLKEIQNKKNAMDYLISQFQ